jgi:hypothetical protein
MIYHQRNVIFFGCIFLVENYIELGAACAASPIGSINMSDIMTGKCIAKIAANDPALRIAPRKNGSPSIWSTIPEALEDVTALFYDEDRNEIYTGNSHGLVHVWSS